MEVAITSCDEGYFNMQNWIGRFPVFEYTEDGSISEDFMSPSTTERNLWNTPINLWSNPITTIQSKIAKFYVKKLTGKEFNPSQFTVRSYLFDFENDIKTDEAFDSLLINIKDYTEQFEKISNFFCFNKTEWAKIFSVSRVTVYDWLNGKTTPTGGNATKISSIYNFLRTIPDIESPISQMYLYQKINKYNKSLKEIFLTSQDIVEEYPGLNETVTAMVRQTLKNKERLVKLAKTKQPKDEILDYNLKSLKY
ncbi:MAG: helix-turn-helix transcriptional regulator [Spirochaetia bacterium]|nr:helix-turn-helix transcriptional regulator [Spirochaetia bacterium]